MQLTGPSESKGPWKNTTLQRFICDAVTEPGVTDVTVMGSAQFGKTEVRLCITGYYMDYEPVPQMGVDPTLDMAKAFSRNRLAKMIKDTPALCGSVSTAYAEKKTGNAILHKEYPGGEYTGSGANSPASLAGYPKAVVIADDIDRFPATTKEGDPLDLAFERTSNFKKKKRIAFSTPTIKDQSRIESRYKESDQRIFEVECPVCHRWQRLRFDQETFKFDAERDSYGNYIVREAWYECEKCHAKINERVRRRLLESMRVRVTNPKVKDHVGFHVWAIYNPKVTMQEIAVKFLKAKDDPKRFQVFTNTVLGELWEVPALLGKSADDFREKGRVEHYTKASKEMMILTCAIDVQMNRLEYLVMGWGAKEESWVITRGAIMGEMDRSDTWTRMYEFLTTPIEYDFGMKRMLDVITVDTGYRATNVYPRIRDIMKLGFDKVYGVKGWRGQQGDDVIHRQFQEKRWRIRLVIVDADKTKDLLFSRLEIKRVEGKPVDRDGYIHFNGSCGTDFFEQLTSEHKISKIVGNRKVQLWEKKNEKDANEALDLVCYNIAALKMLMPINWKKLEARFAKSVDAFKGEKSNDERSGNEGTDEKVSAKVTEKITRPQRSSVQKRPRGKFGYNPLG